MSNEDNLVRADDPITGSTASSSLEEQIINSLAENYSSHEFISREWISEEVNKYSKKLNVGIPANTRKQMIVGYVKGLIKPKLNSKAFNVFVTGIMKRQTKAGKFQMSVYGLLINDDDDKKRIPVKIAGTFANEDRMKALSNCTHFKQYKIFLNHNTEIAWNKEYNYVNNFLLLFMNESTNFDMEVNSTAVNKSLFTIFNQIYKITPSQTVINGCGVSEKQLNSDWAQDTDFKLLIVQPTETPNERFGDYSTIITAHSLGDADETIDIKCYNSPKFVDYSLGSEYLLVAGSIRRNATNDYGVFEMTAMNAQILSMSALTDLLKSSG